MPTGELLGHALTAGSLLIAVVTFAASFLSKRRTDRLTRTLDFVRTIYEHDGPIRQANLELALWLSVEKNLDPDSLTEEDEKTLIGLIDYFDLIADSANRGIVDPEMIAIHLGGKMRSVYRQVENYIKSRREMLKRPGIYKPLEDFVVGYVGDRAV